MNYVWNTLPVLERVFDDVMGPSLGASFANPARGITRVATAQSTWVPPTNWHQTENEIVLTWRCAGAKA